MEALLAKHLKKYLKGNNNNNKNKQFIFPQACSFLGNGSSQKQSLFFTLLE
jgi:hypothetical protein